MTSRNFILIILFSILVGSCYKKRFQASEQAKKHTEKQRDSSYAENVKKEALNQSLKSQNASLERTNIIIDSATNSFRLKYMNLPTGAEFTSESAINGARQYVPSNPLTAQNFLNNPTNISYWGNDVYGDCVTAEEAFAKACNNPEIFIPDNAAIGWASENGVLNGAQLPDVLTKMTVLGFRSSGKTYNDGAYSYVDFRNPSILQSAILEGPVKIGLTATQLDVAWRSYKRGWFALNFHTEPSHIKKHCASLCGFGTLSWLAQQFHVQLPNGVNGQNMGYAIFTWSSIGIIDQQSLLAITHEAWIRNPTTVENNSVSSFVLKAMGGETSKNIYLSHAFADSDLRQTYPGGFGEMWICHDIGGGKIKLEARGAEAGLYLSHAFNKIDLRPTYGGGAGEEWIKHDLGGGQFALEATGGEKGKFLSHAFGNLELRKNMAGGEAWLNTGQQ